MGFSPSRPAARGDTPADATIAIAGFCEHGAVLATQAGGWGSAASTVRPGVLAAHRGD